MSQELEQLVRASNDYPDFKARFSEFCKTSVETLNDNRNLPGVSFCADSKGTGATLLILDQPFFVRFHLVALSDALVGVFGAYLPTPRDEEILL